MEEKKKKAINLSRALLVELLILLTVFTALFWGETRVAKRSAEKQLKEKAESISMAYLNYYRDVKDVTAIYDNAMQSKVDALVILLDNTDKYNEDNLQTLCSSFGVEGIMITDNWQEPEPEMLIEYYTATLKDGRTVAIKQNISDEGVLLNEANFSNRIFNNAGDDSIYIIFSEKNGYIMGWSKSTDDSELLNIEDIGFKLSDVEYEHGKWLIIDGVRYYTYTIRMTDAFSSTVCTMCAVPYSEMAFNSRLAVAILCAFIAMVFTVVVVYSFYNRQDEKKYEKEGNKAAFSNVRQKLILFTTVGLILIGLSAYYIQTLYSLSAHSVESTRLKEIIATDLSYSSASAETITEIHDRICLTDARIVSRIMSDVPELRTRENLAKLSDIFGIEYIMLFDGDGRETLSDSDIFGFEISDDPKSQSYPFNVLKHGVPYYIQDAQKEDLTGVIHQYIGVTMSDVDGNYDGFLQICLSPEALQGVRDSVSFKAILYNAVSQSDSGLLAINKETNDIVYYSENNVIAGQNAFNMGMTEEQVKGNYFGYMNVLTDKLFADSFEVDNHYVYIVSHNSVLFTGRTTMTVFTILTTIVAMIVYTIWFRSKEVEEPLSLSNDPYVNVTTADGSGKRTLNIVSRVLHISPEWLEKSSEEKTRDIVNGVMLFIGFSFAIIYITRNVLYSDRTFLGFITGNRWAKGFNVFALTKSLLFIFNIYLIATILDFGLNAFIRLANPRNETILRLLRSLARYMVVLGVLYYVLSQFGFDSQSLLASAGLLTLIVGLGAKDLVTDVLAGIFIIFENEFNFK